MIPTPRLGAPEGSTSQAVWNNVYLPPSGVVPTLLSVRLRTSCSPIMSARFFAPKRASSSSWRSHEAQVSGLAVAKVRCCCCLAAAPLMNGARRLWCCVGAAPKDFSTGAVFRCEFRGFESCVVGKPIPRHLRRGALYARSPAILKAENESEGPPICGLSQNGVMGQQASKQARILS